MSPICLLGSSSSQLYCVSCAVTMGLLSSSYLPQTRDSNIQLAHTSPSSPSPARRQRRRKKRRPPRGSRSWSKRVFREMAKGLHVFPYRKAISGHGGSSQERLAILWAVLTDSPDPLLPEFKVPIEAVEPPVMGVGKKLTIGVRPGGVPWHEHLLDDIVKVWLMVSTWWQEGMACVQAGGALKRIDESFTLQHEIFKIKTINRFRLAQLRELWRGTSS
ncbi:hypothetical protein B0T24DRAFT_667576 [Lasiosphaeria ovina]|uniref:Uncharacterized protein n=1 Tax=Lasiosphaeria ovina TaxID=92902 RepID=A0AAE0N615_9PEZI|nr:hypothetical protein B0T24DRAFT_667576 [Lasiosphaeria ovina]